MSRQSSKRRDLSRWLGVGALTLALGAICVTYLTGALSPGQPRLVPSLHRGRALLRGDLPLPRACEAAGVAYPPPEPRLLIRKTPRILALYSGERLVKEYSIGLGRDPLPDKEREGDGRTPTGTFYLCTRLGKSRFHRFMGISYPAPDDAERGLEERRITRQEYRAILRAHAARRQPPWNTRLGGAIGIHGGGAGTDWTLGCVALENRHVEEIYRILPSGTSVAIVR